MDEKRSDRIIFAKSFKVKKLIKMEKEEGKCEICLANQPKYKCPACLKRFPFHDFSQKNKIIWKIKKNVFSWMLQQTQTRKWMYRKEIQKFIRFFERIQRFKNQRRFFSVKKSTKNFRNKIHRKKKWQDFFFLEEMKKNTEISQKIPPACKVTSEVTKQFSILTSACLKRDISLFIMPKGLSRHKKNKSFYQISWISFQYFFLDLNFNFFLHSFSNFFLFSNLIFF